jgi:formylglycine-generating enzyme required for sulfatase activity
LPKVASAKLALPTEAQWEYACRAGTTTPFNLGANISPSQVNYHGNYPYNGAPKGEYRGKTTPVGSLPNANAWGLYDMHGNLWEWCSDGYGDYPTTQVIDPQGLTSSGSRVLRGGSWSNNACSCRSAYRNNDSPGNSGDNVGFRALVIATF